MGLNLAKYGMVGLEAGLLMDPLWAPKNALQVMEHGDHSWSGPSGWLSLVKNIIPIKLHFHKGMPPLRTSSQLPRPWPSSAWWLLSILSAIPFVAIPLSGIALEPASGHVLSTSHPTVSGRTYHNFNSRTNDQAAELAKGLRLSATDLRLPNLGIIYTSPDSATSAQAMPHLATTPNSMPVDDGTATIFLPAQGNSPISGVGWGLAYRYNCSVVTDASEYTILAYPSQNETNKSYVFNDTAARWGFSPLGDKLGSNTQTLFAIDLNFTGLETRGFYSNDSSIEYPGLEEDRLHEVLMWQYIETDPGGHNASDQAFPRMPPNTYNTTIDLPIQNLQVPALKDSDHQQQLTENAVAIGVRCRSSSAVGTARLDARTATYTDFQRTNTALFSGQFEDLYAVRMPFIFSYLLAGAFEEDIRTFTKDAFLSVGQLPNLQVRFEGTSLSTYVQTSYLQADQLKRSVHRALASYALALMYDDLTPYVNENVTEAVPGTVLSEGRVPSIVILCMLAAWAGLSAFFTLLYGFRRRWAEALDAQSLFAFGADRAEGMKDVAGVVDTLESLQTRNLLKEIPGLVGDGKSAQSPGHITLVEGSMAADKDKLY
ncbi:hypothetical protein MPH_02250 [Macrophomina phaseolina MS6]|uniref:Uncharacterized protein n=1 Tax=Macrophomina phaseolina (strain MS6) TaxID=1126212 RepID=K2SUV4_MACPH|nr:hypothetical protein MPH_02250 [Macrophomina phaseolina MS6]